VRVEIWSDVVCPWCYIGKRRFERALAGFEHADEVAVTWRSFELDPAASGEPADQVTELAKKYGITAEHAQEMNARMTAAAAGEELEFHLSRARLGNSFDAHRLIHMAAEQGLAERAEERLFAAYFIEGLAISDRDVLARLAGEIGLDPEGARRALDDGSYVDDVREDERLAASFGITAVPFFVLDRRYGVAGAQPPDLLVEALRQAWAEQAAPRTA
jgi:predicted DsbA family dithiol-disulfide isomerase